VLFFRRDHPQTSVRAYPAYRDRIAWFDPRLHGRLQLTHWRWLHEYTACLRRAPLEPEERRRCWAELALWFGWNVRGLLKDVAKAVLWPAIRPVRQIRRALP